MIHRLSVVLAATLCLVSAEVRAQQVVSLMPAGKAGSGWAFDNGREFPGATGKLSVDADAQRGGKESLRLDGDFTKGGNYVQAGYAIEEIDIRTLSMWLRYDGTDRLTTRVVDATGQCHQIVLKLKPTDQWQQVIFPLQQYFERRGKPDAVAGVVKYEYWGGAKDGKWHGPAKGLYLLVGRDEEKRKRTLWINNVTIVTRPAGPRAGAAGVVTRTVRLDEYPEDEVDWTFTRGQEFPGATGSLTLVKDQPAKGKRCVKLAGNFTKGGAYVEMKKTLDFGDARDMTAIRMLMRSENVSSICVRLNDATGQCHQNKNVPVQGDGQWHELVIKPTAIAGGEHWGGANDGTWHGPATLVALLLNTRSDQKGKQPVMYVADIRAEVLVPAVVQAATFREGFEASQRLPDGWQAGKGVRIDLGGGFRGTRCLLLDRPAADVDSACEAASPTIKLAGGTWQLAVACRSDLNSPDNSYHGAVTFECLGASGKVLRRIGLGELFGKRNWKAFTQRVELPADTSAGRFRVRLSKAVGQFRADELSAASVAAAAPKDTRISRVLFATAQVGNLLLPDDSRAVQVTVECTKPLRIEQKRMTCVVRDYWGAEHSRPIPAELTRTGKRGGTFLYGAKVDLAAAELEVGKYYELHAEVPRPGGEPFTNHTSLAILPPAVTKAYKPQEIPFTSRNWDNRITEFIRLTDRLGVRICGIWGGWSADPPQKPHAPQIELCAKLGMGVLTGTPAHAIESLAKGYEKYDEKALRQGVRNFIGKYGKTTRPLIISLGNEPHGTGDRVRRNIAAYRVLYEEIKKTDPGIFVLGTSVGPQEEYFQNGFQKWCDGYDFHIYEDSRNVRRALEKYRALFARYGGAKPIWSTEVGLNSQGMTRQAVAVELVKKFSVFFAAGGRNVSWFGLLYPDRDGTAHGSSTDSHNVFDCRYNRYCPRLDAVAYYNMVNAICIKKFVAEKTYADGIRAFLFRDRDGRDLIVLWKDKGRQDMRIPLAGAGKVLVIRIDGTRSELDAAAGGGGVTLTVSEDPLLLLCDKGPEALPARLGPPAAAWASLPALVVKGGSVTVAVTAKDLPADAVALLAPPSWQVARSARATDDAGAALAKFHLAAPLATAAREGNLVARITGPGGALVGELSGRVAVAGALALRLLPTPAAAGRPAGVKLIVANNSTERKDVAWRVALVGQQDMTSGRFAKPGRAKAYFAAPSDGIASVEGGGKAIVVVPLAGVEPLTIYRVQAAVSDPAGRTVTMARPMAGFVRVPKAKAPLKLDGALDEADWKNCPVQRIDTAKQFYPVSADAPKWKGPADLSAKVRYLWDDKHLYLAAEVTDDAFRNPKEGAMIWAQDGLQFLVDPAREHAEKPGKYDLAAALSKTGPLAWCYLSADAGAPAGQAKDIVVAARRGTGGNIVYELAVPWSRVAPFRPEVGANLGLALIVNEDDGPGRRSFMGWFGDVHAKQVDTVADLILAE